MFHVTKNDTPKMIKMSSSNNKLAQCFYEHIKGGDNQEDKERVGGMCPGCGGKG